MRTITVNGIQIEVDENCEVVIEGAKVTIRAKASQEQNIHYHHYYSPFPYPGPIYVSPTFAPWQPNIGVAPLGWSSTSETLNGASVNLNGGIGVLQITDGTHDFSTGIAGHMGYVGD